MASYDVTTVQELRRMSEAKESGSTVNEYLTKIRDDSGPVIVKPLFEENIKFEFWGQCIEELKENVFYGKENKDPHEHIYDIFKIIDLFHSPGVSRDQVILMAFPFTLKVKAKQWMKRLSTGSITTWDLFKSAFLDEHRPPLKIINCLEHNLNEHEQLRIFYQGLDAKTRCKADFKGPIPIMTPTKGIRAIKELSEHSLSWYKEGNIKDENEELQTVLKQINNFENNMNIIIEEVRMAQHREAGSLPSSTETNPRGLAHAITTRSGLNYKPPKNPRESNTNSQDKTVSNETITKNNEEQFSINIPFIEALEQMPKYAKFMKDLLAKKGKAKETSKITLNERCSAVLLNKIPLKEKDPESFTIPCVIGKIGINKALADLGANISFMPHFMFARLDLGELKPTRMCIELANKSTQYPRRIAEHVIVKIDKFIFPVDFVVLDMEEDHKILIILGRPFLATAHAMIDVFNKKISFKIGNETINFDIEKSMKFSTPEDDTCLSIDMVDVAVTDHVQNILPSYPLDSFLFESIIIYQQSKVVNLWGDEGDKIEHNLDESNTSRLSSNSDNWESNDFTKLTLFTATREAEAQIPKLKELPSHLEYAFLDDNQEFPVIISSLLSSQEKESLLQMEDDFKPVVQSQRRLNPKVQDVVKAEIVKLLNAGSIYAISDSLWVESWDVGNSYQVSCLVES
ncbi:hypothetical protein Tco_0487704 [Tanacetum coccineum]